MGMLHKIKSTGLRVEVEIKGKLIYADHPAFRQIVELVGTQENQILTFDLRELEFIDSAGLGMLLLARDKILEVNGIVILKGPVGQVLKMIELGRFDTLFQIEH